MKSLKSKKKKLVLTSFDWPVLLFQSKNIIKQFMKTYLHRPIKILQFFALAGITELPKGGKHRDVIRILWVKSKNI